VRIETLLEETIQPKLQEIAEVVIRLEAANDKPEDTPSGRELARRVEEAKYAATTAHTDALKAAIQAQTALESARGILATWQDIKSIINLAARAVVVMAGCVAILVGAHTLGLIN
jgi:hypothetical protein